MRSLLSSFLGDQSGATAIEYALIAMGIAIVIVAAVNGVGTKLSGTFASGQHVAEIAAGTAAVAIDAGVTDASHPHSMPAAPRSARTSASRRRSRRH